MLSVLSMFVACSLSSPEPSQPPAQSDKHLIVIVVDTTRADLLAAASTPNIDALAAKGQVVERAWSAGTWTVPGVTSLMNGHAVRAHGWDLGSARIGRYPALPEVPMLAEVLDAEGFATVGLHANPYLSEALGFDRGFDTWRRVSDKTMAKELSKKLAATDPQARHFVYLHYIGPHSPLHPSEEAQARHELDPRWFQSGRMGMEIGVAKRNQEPGAREAYRAGYIAALEDTDARIGEALEVLAPLLDDAVVILTSDHGELLGEHGRVGHGWYVHEPLTWVPFVATGVDQALPAHMSTAALPAIAVRELGINAEFPVKPSSLVASQREGKLALTDGRYRGEWDEKGAAYFDLDNDPLALQPLTVDPGMEALRARYLEQTPQAAPLELQVQLPKETQEQLQALGYQEGAH